MDTLFLSILNMSLTGAFVIVAVCLTRQFLKKAPKIISYALWAVVGFRLVFPFTIESIFGLIPFNTTPIPMDIAIQPIPRINSGIPVINNAVQNVLPAGTLYHSANPLQIWVAVGSWVWITGATIMLIYGVVSYMLLKGKMQKATHVGANIYEAEDLKSPFVLGVFSPKIFLPTGLAAHERGYILLHEETHIRRRDHIAMFVAYFILSLHWFNPLAWLAFFLMGADMEMSCDEHVIKKLGGDISEEYSKSLVRIATGRRLTATSPLAFGEGGIKVRVKRVLNFKKPSRLIIIVAVMLVAVLSVGFAMNRAAQDYETHLGDSEDNSIPLATWTETVSVEMYNEMGRDHILQKLSEHTHVEIIIILSWLDFITDEQFQIVRDYLGIEPGGFDDQIFLKYLMDDMTRHYLVHYDRIPFEEMPNNPRRILTRMYEAWALAHIEYRANIVGSVCTRYVHELEREVYDWRQDLHNRPVNAAPENEELYNMQIKYVENPARLLRDIQLIWNDVTYHATPSTYTSRGRQIGYANDEYSAWRIYELIGQGHEYLLAVESEYVWRVMSVHPPEAPSQLFVLENATDELRFTRLSSVSLYQDGTAVLATPPISSFMLMSRMVYSFEDNRLVISNAGWDDNIEVIFDIDYDGALLFRSANIPVFADEGARYVLFTGSHIR